MPIKRTVPRDDPLLQGMFLDLMKRLDWPEVVEDDEGDYRFKPNRLFLWIIADAPMGGGLSMNDMAIAYARGQFTLDEYASFYMGLGYKLDAFLDIFHHKFWPGG